MTQLSQALTQANVTSSTFAYFDLIDHVDTQLIDGELKARVLGSLAWNLDNRAIFLARNVFFETYRESMETGTLDAFNEFTNAMNEVAAGQAHTPVGFESTSSFTQLVVILNMRKAWHDKAEQAATRPYQPKTLHAMVVDDKAREVSVDTRNKLAVRAKFAGGSDEQMISQILVKLIDKSNATLQQQHEMRQKMVKPVLHILALAGARADAVYDGESPPFNDLPLREQISLIEQASVAVDRALNDMGLSSRVTVDDYTIALRDGAELTKTLKQVLKSPRFNNPNDD